MLEKQVDQRDRTDGGGAVEGILASLVADADGSGRFVLFEELAGEVEVGLGGYEVEDCLERS